MPIGLRIDSLTFSGRQEPITTGGSDLIVLIGPNNAGKSRALREIQAHLVNQQPGNVVTAVTATREGDEDELLSWLSDNAARIPAAAGVPELVRSSAVEIAVASVKQLWTHHSHLADLAAFLIRLVDAESRLQLAGSVPSVDSLHGHAVQPLQRLLGDHEAEARLSKAVERAFGTPICVNRAGGSELHLLLGTTTSPATLDSAEYLAELRELPLVADQGDGMRSFIGLLVTLIATPYPLVLIDEPEAFLHPPQARELGRQLAELGESQRFVATHDSDVLLGLLDRAESITLIRLRRKGERNIPAVLDREQVKELWRDPSFRYSNLLDGLFHPGVVICEADGDATLYSAALDSVLEEEEPAASDLLFTQCGGKHKMPTAIAALLPMGVPVVAIADIDVLREEDLLKRILAALGGTWEAFRDDWKMVSTAVEQLGVDAPLIGDVRAQIEASLGEDPTAQLTEEQSRRVREITKSRDGWRRVKEAGLSALPNGDARGAAERLVRQLKTVGLFVVDVGTLEGWAPEIGGHGPVFVDAALGADIQGQNDALREFILSAARFLQGVEVEV